MKRILIVIVVLSIIFAGCSDYKKLSGVWQCSYYAIYTEHSNEWKNQPQAFIDLFGLTLYEDGKAITNTFGQKNDGMYTLHSDTLILNISNSQTYYIWDDNTLTLVGHPRAKIIYTKASD